MSTPLPRLQRQNANRERILGAIREAAISAFDQHGFRGTSTQDIATRAGLSKPQLHYYIVSKEALYQELLQDVLHGWSAGFVFEDPNSDQPADVLREYIRKKVDYSLDFPALSRIFTRELLDGGPNLGRYWPIALASINQKVAVIENWMRTGQIRRTDPRLLLINIWSMTQHYADYDIQVRIMLGVAPGAPMDREPIVRSITDMVLRCCGLVRD
ncbi:TetR family transcriptional regulator C-terminal domain-containing protein [Bordetella genomosp. 11]|uniref:TetR family transcriptional regulator n=1 Tax=Bordetella genomosp. 11 TaxID=1416808 RepID=A0A261UPT1_9BORD|nr:TetR family transcriptional regulator C-terminal domain-containing protein [Bordetella genomosp. 11]OZI63372.1 TetR family transcriptional regulator [Bordetella genomosp. 11]